MPNILKIDDDLNLFPIPQYRRYGGKGSGVNQAMIDQQYEKQRQLISEQQAMFREQQLAADLRFKQEQEAQRIAEEQKKTEAAQKLAEETKQQNKKEQAVAQEAASMFGFSSTLLGDYNLSRPVIERPDYEEINRPL